jgi:nucleoside-diphosphate-sugar epimerase
MRWKNRKVLVTGGASFIGSHLVDRLVAAEAKVRVVDDFSSGRLANIERYVDEKQVELQAGDLNDQQVARDAVRGVEVVFHLAADHGGRGYVDLHQAGPASNLHLDGLVFREAVRAGVEKVVYASSGCVYPSYLQADTAKELYLDEHMSARPTTPTTCTAGRSSWPR